VRVAALGRKAIRHFGEVVVGPTASWDHVALVAGETIADPRLAVDPILQLELKLSIAAAFPGEADAERVEPCSASRTTMLDDLRGD